MSDAVGSMRPTSAEAPCVGVPLSSMETSFPQSTALTPSKSMGLGFIVRGQLRRLATQSVIARTEIVLECIEWNIHGQR